ncbi:DUF7146 domain-containing protein [Vibrio maritimus]|uniref:DUF7146 domain-containing protein n=1 Tax=Vibrio maritimus TaxID=990268 RepID=UPI004069632D
MDKFESFVEFVDFIQQTVARHGGWSAVFSAYPALDDACQKCRKGTSVAGPCPITKEGDTVFRLYKDWESVGGGYHNQYGRMGDGIDMVAWLENCSKGKACYHILDILGETTDTQRDIKQFGVKKEPKVTQIDSKELEKRRWILSQVESRSDFAARSSIAKSYAENRGLKMPLPDSVGFNPTLKTYASDGSLVSLPGLVFYVVNEKNETVTMHRIFLEPDGSDKSQQVDNAKMMCSPIKEVNGSSIRLGEPTLCKDNYGNPRIVLGVCEGPETGLAIQEAESFGIWSGISSTIMERMWIPEIVTDLVIFEDKDRPHKLLGRREGARAAKALAARIKKARPNTLVTRCTPPGDIQEGKKSQDWLDEYQHGVEHFPSYLSENGLTIVR